LMRGRELQKGAGISSSVRTATLRFFLLCRFILVAAAPGFHVPGGMKLPCALAVLECGSAVGAAGCAPPSRQKYDEEAQLTVKEF